MAQGSQASTFNGDDDEEEEREGIRTPLEPFELVEGHFGESGLHVLELAEAYHITATAREDEEDPEVMAWRLEMPRFEGPTLDMLLDNAIEVERVDEEEEEEEAPWRKKRGSRGGESDRIRRREWREWRSKTYAARGAWRTRGGQGY
jgi:hypothetical protein